MLVPKGSVRLIVDNPHSFKGYIKFDKETSLGLEIKISPSTADLKSTSETKATLNGQMYIEYSEKFSDGYFYKVYIGNNCDLFFAKQKNKSKEYFSARITGNCGDFQALNAGEIFLKSLTSIN